jgi:excalibur calcium-binding domain-containing protein
MTAVSAHHLTHGPDDRDVARAAVRLFAVVGVVLVLLAAAPLVLTQVRDAGQATSYGSCAALVRDYPTGVGTVAAVDGLVQRRLPVMDDRAYAANARLDTDGDGIACERR